MGAGASVAPMGREPRRLINSRPSAFNEDLWWFPAIIVFEALKMAKRKQHQRAKRMIGRFVVADPAICHGQPTFRGTRILVADVLEQVASGMAWETIVEEWRGDISSQAISEAVRPEGPEGRAEF